MPVYARCIWPTLWLLALACQSDPADSTDSGDPDTTIGVCESQPIATPIEAEQASLPDGTSFLYTTHESPKGLVLIFHGGGGSKEDNLFDRIDPVLIAREALARDFAVASIDSAKHLDGQATDRKWSDIMNMDPEAGEVNPDVRNAKEMIQRLTDPSDLAAVPPSTEVIALGYSNGGSMVSRVAQFLPVSVAVTYISNSVEFFPDNATRPPMTLVPGQNDLDHLASSTTAMLEERIESEGGAVQRIENPPDPLTPGLFTRIPGVSCEASQGIVQTLQDNGWLDDSMRLTRNPKADVSWREALPTSEETLDAAARDVLLEAYAEHAPASDWNPEVWDFVEAHLNSTP